MLFLLLCCFSFLSFCIKLIEVLEGFFSLCTKLFLWGETWDFRKDSHGAVTEGDVPLALQVRSVTLQIINKESWAMQNTQIIQDGDTCDQYTLEKAGEGSQRLGYSRDNNYIHIASWLWCPQLRIQGDRKGKERIRFISLFTKVKGKNW